MFLFLSTASAATDLAGWIVAFRCSLLCSAASLCWLLFRLSMLFGELVEQTTALVNMMSLAQAPGIMTAVDNLAAADFFLAIAFQSWQNRCDEKKNCISNACRDHIALR
jgi:hypothetical protein